MLKIGKRVMVAIPSKELTVSPAVKAYDGTKARVIGEHSYSRYGTKTYYLEGCVSKFGMLYEFFEEWLIPLDVEGAEK